MAAHKNYLKEKMDLKKSLYNWRMRVTASIKTTNSGFESIVNRPKELAGPFTIKEGG